MHICCKQDERRPKKIVSFESVLVILPKVVMSCDLVCNGQVLCEPLPSSA